MNDFRKCSICGTIFAYTGRAYCSRCALDIEEAFVLVREYLEENPGAGVMQITDETEISEKVIMQLIRDGRLITSDNGGGITQGMPGKRCSMCRKPIAEGTLCKSCSVKTANLLKKDMDKFADSNKKQLKMHTREDSPKK